MIPMQDRTIDTLLREKKVVILCGTGGVGKTTLSAALAIRGSILGKRTIVVTIDPAKRLLEALGWPKGIERKDLTPLLKTQLAKQVLSDSGGTLEAYMPNYDNNIEFFLRSLTKEEETISRIVKNPFMKVFAQQFAGLHDYLALYTLCSLAEDPHYDLVILDTPPSRSLSQFLSTPEHLLAFFENSLMKWVLSPPTTFLTFGPQKALKVLQSLTGSEFIENTTSLVTYLFQLKDAFLEQAHKIQRLLANHAQGGTGFVSVFALQNHPQQLDHPEEEIMAFIQLLKQKNYAFEGCILNKSLRALARTEATTKETAFLLIESLQNYEEKFLKTCDENGIPLLAKIPALARQASTFEDLYEVSEVFSRISPTSQL